MGRFVTFYKTVVTSPLALGRMLWQHGEAELARQALTLDPEVVLDIGTRTAELLESGEAREAWPEGPRYRSLLLAVAERLEGTYRPCRLSIALPESGLPAEYQATEKQRRRATAPVERALEARRRAGHPVP